MEDDSRKERERAESRRKWREDREEAERVLERRRQRYAANADYREAIKASVRRQRAKKPKSTRKRSFNRDRIIMVADRPVVLWSIGKTANYIGVAKRTLSEWERKGVVPMNRSVDNLGRRWYPRPYVEFLAEQIQYKKPNERLDAWASRVKEAWMLRQSGEHRIPVVE